MSLSTQPEERLRGTIDKVAGAAGYGFIKTATAAYFFTLPNVENRRGKLRRGQAVTFEVLQSALGKKKAVAFRVRVE